MIYFINLFSYALLVSSTTYATVVVSESREDDLDVNGSKNPSHAETNLGKLESLELRIRLLAEDVARLKKAQEESCLRCLAPSYKVSLPLLNSL